MKNKNRPRLFIFSFFIFFLCSPVMAETEEIDEDMEIYEIDEIVVYEEGYIPLDADATAYIIVDIKKMRPIFDIIPVNQLKSWQAAMVIDKTEIAIAALFPGDTERFFQIVGFGAYPRFTANIALFVHKNWKYVFSKKNYYYSNADRLSVKLTREEAYIVAWRRAQMYPVPEEPGVKLPEGFTAFRHSSGESAPLSLWVENRNSILNNIFENERISVNLPVERIYLNLYHVEDNIYKAGLMIQLSDFFSWRNFEIRLLTRRSNSVLRALFFANPWVQKGRNIEFQSGPLSQEEITLLIGMFVRNWR